MKRSKLSKEKYLRKRVPGSGIKLNFVFKEINGLINEINELVTSEEDPNHPLNF